MLKEEEKIFEGAVVWSVAEGFQIECVKGANANCHFFKWHYPLTAEHQNVRVFDFK